MSHLSRWALLRYGMFGLPLAFAGLPIYVHLPSYYHAVHAMDLALIGSVLLFVRLLDAVQDPLIGWAADRWPHYRKSAVLFCVLLLAGSYAALFYPVALTGMGLTIWLSLCLILVYFAFSVLTILYSGLGVELGGGDYHENTRVTSAREGIMLAGVILAAVLPQILTKVYGMAQGFIWFSLMFTVTLAACALPLLRMRQWNSVRILPAKAGMIQHTSWRECFSSPNRRWLFSLFFVNALPVALTSNLFIFFVEDRLMAPQATGYLLALYFLSAAVSVPFWSWITRHYGKRRPLQAAMVLALGSFMWTYALGSGDVLSFAIICALSGIAVGGDVAILPSLLADSLHHHPQIRSLAFGIWNFLTKLSLALAAGLSLPLLDQAGFQPSQFNHDAALDSLSIAYALVPCFLKLIAFILLSLSPIDKRNVS
ncbi:MAG: MFS transporter [Rickettsiales bacterium]|nr:MFS transporter [Rickettsiales bacterium]